MDEKLEEDQLIKAFGLRMKQLRKERSMTQRKVADLMGIDEASYQRIERGATNPTYRTMIKLSKALKVTIQSLFEE